MKAAPHNTLQISAEQEALRQTLRGFFAERAGSDYRRTRLIQLNSSDSKLWDGISELGLPEFAGSTDEDAHSKLLDLGLIAFEAGYGLVPEALIEALFAGPYFSARLSADKDKSAFTELIAGQGIGAFVSGKLRASIELLSAQRWSGLTFAGADSNGNGKARVSGTLNYVLGGDCADVLIFCAGSNGTVIVVSLEGNSAKRTPSPSLDGTQKLCCLELTGARYVTLSSSAALTYDSLRALKAMELAGVTARVVSMTQEFVRARAQFGVQIGAFQAVQHQLADMYLRSEALASLAKFACWASDHSPSQGPLASEAAISFACEVASEVVEQAIQLHGGVGFTWEHDLHLFLRRARFIEARFAPSALDHARLLGAADSLD